jgi:hypothetical protein
MFPFVLYFVTAVVTGFHVYTLVSIAVYGVPVNLLELLSLLGSFCLLIAAYVSLFRPHAAARLALLACLVMWSFYAPAIAKIVRTRLAKPAAVSQFMGSTVGAMSKHSFIATQPNLSLTSE